MIRPSFIQRLRDLATGAAALVKTLHETERAPAGFQLAGLNEAQQIIALLDGMGQGDDKSRALAVAFIVQDGLSSLPAKPDLVVQTALFTVGSFLVETGSKPLPEIEKQLLDWIRAGYKAGPMRGPGE